MTPEELAAQSEKIQYKLWEYGLRLSIFRSTTDRAIVETSQFLSYQSMTTTVLCKQWLSPGEGTENEKQSGHINVPALLIGFNDFIEFWESSVSGTTGG